MSFLKSKGSLTLKLEVLFFLLGGALALPVAAQTPATPLVNHAVDETKLVTLRGSVHPLARASSDRGAVADSFSASRLILLLNQPPEREAALKQFLQDAHTRGSASYHKWLTPEQFGAQFGPADEDIQAATAWLGSHGFQVAKTSKSGQFVEFSGTAGQLREAFHTQIHQYDVHGETHYANATEVKIPAALTALVKGVSPMNDFRAKRNLQVAGQALYSRSTRKATPLWTLPNPQGSGNFYTLAPEDFATQYDLAPLYRAGVNGAGQTIGIINDSNIDLSLDNAFRSLFNLSSKPAQVVLDGADPGVNGDAIEAYLDIEEAGAVAPGATVNLYIASTNGLFTGDYNSSTLVDPLYMAALRAVEDNQASVLSMSFQNCEGFLSQSGNALWSAIWEQAAAQGQTVLVSSGDSGSAGCDNANDQWTTEYGLAVNGLASTPWDVAVGGTDFYYSDYATGGASMANLWNQTNDADNGSLKAPLPEQVWDTVYGFNAIGPYVQLSSVSIPAGGGGASGCINSVASTTSGSALPFICAAGSPGGVKGYAKPSWQNAPEVPSDGVRDIPDLSLFAANGQNFSAYPICAMPGDCVPDASGTGTISMVGGTSASTPAMAGIMALVNQKYGRQGQANYTLYPLAQQFPAAFHDVTLGSNNMTCLKDKPDCSLDKADTFYSLQEYPAAAGYDLASGLGSVDASVLVNDWNSITFKPTATTMQVTPASAQHGDAISFSVTVKASSGGKTPQGSVTILNNSPAPLSAGKGVFTIDSKGTATGTLSDLPGGSYQVWAQYAGDGTYASSYSDPQMVTISPAASTLNIYGFGVPGQTLNPAAPCLLAPNQAVYEQATAGGPWEPSPSGTTFGADSQVAPVAIVNGVWPSFGTGTGSVTFAVDGTPQATVALNSYGYAGWIPPTTFNAGTHTIGAAYSGDASYAASAAAPYTLIVPKVTPSMSAWPAANCANSYGPAPTCTFSAGDNLRVEVQIYEANCHVPTGALTVNAGSLSQNITLVPGGLITRSTHFLGYPVLSGEAVFQNLPAGTYTVTASYAGDANSLPNTSAASSNQLGQYGLTYTVVATAPPAPLLPTTTAMTVSPPSMQDTFWSGVYLTADVTGGPSSTIPPTGSVDFFEDGVEITYGPLTPAGANSATVTAYADGLSFDLGSSQLKAVYSGDSVYQSSAILESYQITLSTTPDFLLAPQLPQISVPSGTSNTVSFNLNSLNDFNSSVALSCSTSSSLLTCSLNPSTVTVNGQATATTTLTISAASKTTALAAPKQPGPFRWPIAAGMVFFGFLMAGGRAHRKLKGSLLLSLALFAAFAAAGCNSISGSPHGSTPTPKPAPTLVTYTVLVTGTANGIIHNAKITVVVP
jgi:hypothetical protein